MHLFSRPCREENFVFLQQNFEKYLDKSDWVGTRIKDSSCDGFDLHLRRQRGNLCVGGAWFYLAH